MKRRALSVCILGLSASVLWSSESRAQTGTSVLEGKVQTSTNKEPVAEALVTVTSAELQVEQIVVTDGSGFYRVPNLPSGTYMIRVDKDSFLPYERTGIPLRADITLRNNIDLIPEA